MTLEGLGESGLHSRPVLSFPKRQLTPDGSSIRVDDDEHHCNQLFTF